MKRFHAGTVILVLLSGFSGALAKAAAKPAVPDKRGTADKPAAIPGAKIGYTLDKTSLVTVNITRPDGWVVRELLVGVRQNAGPHEISWDGRDNLGYLLAPGPYQSRIATHDGITWEYVTSVGNSGTPPWPTADRSGGWGGNHGQNMAVAVDPSGTYLGWVGTEGPACILKRTHDGSKGIWGMALGPFEGVICLAADGKHLFGVNQTRLIVIDKDKGQQLATLNIQAGPPGEVQAPLPSEFTRFSWGFASHQPPPKGDPLVWGLAAGGGRVYVSLPWRNLVEVYEVVVNGGTVELKLKADENLTVARPAGLALDGKGHILVVSASERRVLQFDLKTRQGQPVLQGLESPFALARTPEGTLYVAEMAPLHQVKKFSAAGKLLATFGKKGGLVGAEYAPDSFLHPCALAANPDGSVWFVDDRFKRMGIVSSEGKPLYAGFGSVNYAAHCAINPRDPHEVFTTMWQDTTFRIDLAKTGWSQPGRVLHVKWQGDSKGLDLGFGATRLLARDKRTYVWTGTGLSIVEQDHLRPVMYFSPRLKDDGPVGELARKRDAKARGWNCDPTIWCDLNGDAAVQDEEIQFVPLPGAKHGPQYFGFGDMLDDFTLATYGYAWKPREFTAAGVPVFRPEDIQVSATHNPVVSWADECQAAMALPNGGFCGVSHVADPGYPLGQGFWSGRSSGEAIRGYDSNWKFLWRIGRKARRTARPGEMYFLHRSIGTLDDCALFGDVEGCVHVVHQDGFYLQRILQDGWHTRAIGPDVIGVENFSGSVFKHPETGRRYLTISGAEATHVFELKGLESARVLPPRPLKLAASLIAADVAAYSAKGEYRIQRVPDGTVPMPAHLGGILPQSGLNWVPDVTPLVILREGLAVGEVRMLYDKENLYVLAQSLNSHGEPPALLHPEGEFVNGNPLAAGETMVVLLSALPGKKAAPVAAGAVPSRFRFVMSNVSIWGSKVTIQHAGEPGGKDRWKGAPRNSHVEPMPYQNGTCYHLVIPLAGILPAQDQQEPILVKLDVGLITVDPATKKASIAYWSGKGQKAHDPVDLTFHPENWGTALFAPEAVMGESTATAVALKTRGPAADAGRWTGVKGYGLAGLPEADAPASFQTAWDDTTFYARVKVSDPTPLQNRAGVPEMLFKGGDAVSLVFGPAGNEGGEQRVVLARVDGKSTVMMYRPKSETKQPYTFKSPISTETFDFVSPMPGAKVIFNVSKTGYVADISIPWKALGYVPAAARSIPFDVQVIFSDGAGSANASCAWWRSTSAEAHANNDIPSEARLYPEQWGRLVLEGRPADPRRVNPKPRR